VRPTRRTAFQKQEAIKKTPRKLIAKNKGKKYTRYYKDVGLGFKTPRSAIEGKYIDKKCPFTSDVSIRGRIVKGVVASTKMNRTIIIRKDYLHYISKYNRYEKRHKNVAAHASPAFKLKEGDIVTLGECRPLSKTVRFNVISHEPVAEGMQKKFVCF
jgi:small subunit ribosomal protein S11e